MVTVTESKPITLRVDYEDSPSNLPPDRPRFSWQLDRETGGQSAYQLLVSRSPETLDNDIGDAWDSGKVETSDSVNVVYDGAPLAADSVYYWKVRIWDDAGNPTAYSDSVSFGTALEEADWTGSWIGHQPDPGDTAGYRSQWQPEESATEQWVQVDLGELREFETVELTPATATAIPTTPDGGPVRGQFGFPEGYRIEAANDPSFEDPRLLVDRPDGDSQRRTRRFELGPTTARYVRVTATDQHVFDPVMTYYRKNDIDVGEDFQPWAAFALSNLAVRDRTERNLAHEQPVRASSSHESDVWGREFLVNDIEGSRDASSSPLLRTEVSLPEGIQRARVHMSAVGYGELYVNGDRIGDEVLDPAWTKYQDRVLAETYDVTDAVCQGENCFGLWLGRGWFSKQGRGAPRARLHLTIELADGSVQTIGTDGSWRATASPIVDNDVYDGEMYDARLEQDGWAEPGFDDSDWSEANEVAGPGGIIQPQRLPPIRVTETFDPEEIREHEDGHLIDFGQNHTGWLEIDVNGLREGNELVLRHAETLTEDGGLQTTDLRSADATDTYVATGDETEGDTYEPRFTYHGYRYAQVSGYPGELTAEDVTSKVVHTDFDTIGSFDCSNEALAQLNQNSRWGLRSNTHSVPTDCPQRNERLGWTGDAQLTGRALMYNFDAAGFHEKWMRDHDDAQSRAGHLPPVVPPRHRFRISDPSWTVTRVVIPWYLYVHYGDKRVLDDHYDEMCQYVDYWHSVAEDGIVPERYGDYGDWLAFENNDGRRGKPFELFNTAFHYRTTDLMAQIANVLEYDADAERYRERADAIADAFNDRFYDPETKTYEPETQSAFAIPLHMGIVPHDDVEAIVTNLVEKVRSDGEQLRTGFLGTRALINTLVDHGEAELAYEIVSQPERPGWVYMVQNGATTLWERWDSDDRIGSGMNSYNHSPFALVSEWFYRALVGVQFDEAFPQERSVTVDPAFVTDLEWASGSVETPAGTVESAWERTTSGIELSVTIPWNVNGTIRVQTDKSVSKVAVDGATVWDGKVSDGRFDSDGIESVTQTDGTLEITVAAGEYDVEITR